MKKPLFLLLLMCLSLSLFSEDSDVDPATELRVAAVQMEISDATFSSKEAFWSSIEKSLADAASQGAELVIFPEYLGVFYPLIQYSQIFEGTWSLFDALMLLYREKGRQVTPYELFIRGGLEVEEALGKWSDLARKYEVTLVGGSFFVPQALDDGTAEIRNRTYVFDSDGAMLYQQDKVFLTDFELYEVGLSSGLVSDAVGFDLHGRRITMTICRDTYFSPWVDQYREKSDLWIDIKANGVVFDREQELSFQRALPARLAESGVDQGVTVCLVGSYMDLLWQGRSSFIEQDDDRVVITLDAADAASYELLIQDIQWP